MVYSHRKQYISFTFLNHITSYSITWKNFKLQLETFKETVTQLHYRTNSIFWASIETPMTRCDIVGKEMFRSRQSTWCVVLSVVLLHASLNKNAFLFLSYKWLFGVQELSHPIMKFSLGCGAFLWTYLKIKR